MGEDSRASMLPTVSTLHSTHHINAECAEAAPVQLPSRQLSTGKRDSDCSSLHLLEAGCRNPGLFMLPLQVQQRVPIMVSVSKELVSPEAHNIQKLLAQPW